ncbi:L-asparaginase [Marininema halotolerans]|uniref:L-asparaginase n=2 Tax=Marininema halotolerans TaxID=1155944 RepID=A0A1I6TXR4_9BACL|nr:L-asparaginase [Marininema halotolerans]
MAADESSGSVLPQGSEALQDVIPLLEKVAHVSMEHFLNLPSPHITPLDMYTISLRIKELLQSPEVDGVVITHGTDTLEETAYYLDLVLASEKPVVLTGAMRSQDELGADGPPNLVHAVRTAAHDRSKNRGVLVVFNDEIHAASQVTKTHTSNLATFRSPSQGPIGAVTKRDILYHRSVDRCPPFPLKKPASRVDLIKATAGSDDLLIRASLDAGAEGLVIEAFGAGNLPPLMLPGLKEAIARRIPIVLVSRCYNGFVEDTYGYEGGGSHLKKLGLIFSNGLNGQKARILLLAALQQSTDPEELHQLFQRSSK